MLCLLVNFIIKNKIPLNYSLFSALYACLLRAKELNDDNSIHVISKFVPNLKDNTIYKIKTIQEFKQFVEDYYTWKRTHSFDFISHDSDIPYEITANYAEADYIKCKWWKPCEPGLYNYASGSFFDWFLSYFNSNYSDSFSPSSIYSYIPFVNITLFTSNNYLFNLLNKYQAPDLMPPPAFTPATPTTPTTLTTTTTTTISESSKLYPELPPIEDKKIEDDKITSPIYFTICDPKLGNNNKKIIVQGTPTKLNLILTWNKLLKGTSLAIIVSLGLYGLNLALKSGYVTLYHGNKRIWSI
jgi:hypothetical protein